MRFGRAKSSLSSSISPSDIKVLAIVVHDELAVAPSVFTLGREAQESNVACPLIKRES